MQRRSVPYLALSALVLIMAGALAIADQEGRRSSLFVAGHEYGTGEQQVYAIDERAILAFRFRRQDGRLVSKSLRVSEKRSVAFTVEGFDSTGAPVLAVATAGNSRKTNSSASAESTSSPSVGSDGSAPLGNGLSDLAPASLILSGLAGQAPASGATWKSLGTIRLPFAKLTITLTNTAREPANAENTATLQVSSSGRAEVSGSTRVPSFGAASLRGGVAVASSSYLERDRRLLLGLSLKASGAGNARNAHGERAAYNLTLEYAMRLVRFVQGTPPPPSRPPFGDQSLGSPASPDISNRAPAPISTMANPAPTNTSYVPSPLPTVAPTPGPAESLPPIPIILPSDQPVASPPPAPTPTSS